jgi:hypothetical protein
MKKQNLRFSLLFLNILMFSLESPLETFGSQHRDWLTHCHYLNGRACAPEIQRAKGET